MNDDELYDTIRSAVAVDSRTSLAAIESRGEQLNRRKYRWTAGAAATLTVAAVAVAVPALSSHSGGASPSAVSSNSGPAASGADATRIQVAAWVVEKSATGTVTVSGPQLDLTSAADAAELQSALIAEGVPTAARFGPQSCAYQQVSDSSLVKKVISVNLPASVTARVPVTPAPGAVYTTQANGPAAPVAPAGPAGPSDDVHDPNVTRAVPAADIDKVQYVIKAAALPAGATLQLWSGNPDTNAKYFSVLAGPAPHC